MTDKLRVGVQLFSRNLGDVANNKVTLDWAYGDYLLQDWLGIRAGRIKLPNSLYNKIRDVDLLRTSIIMSQGIYNDTLRDYLIAVNGGGVYGNVDLKAVGNLGYQLLGGSVNPDNESGLKKYIDNNLDGIGELSSSVTTDISYCAAVRWDTPLPGLRLGYSYYKQPSDMNIDMGLPSTVPLETDVQTHTYSIEYTWNNLVVAGEYYTQKFDQEMGGIARNWTAESYYVSASYRFTDLFSVGAYYSIYYPDKDDKDGDALVAVGRPDHKAWEKDLVLSLRFDFNDY